MEALEKYKIGNNVSVALYGYEQEDGSWGGHAGVTVDRGFEVLGSKLYPKEKTYPTKEELIEEIKKAVAVQYDQN